jgi:hypothetical protein
MATSPEERARFSPAAGRRRGEQADEVRRLRLQGATFAEIGRRLGVTRAHAQRLWVKVASPEELALVSRGAARQRAEQASQRAREQAARRQQGQRRAARQRVLEDIRAWQRRFGEPPSALDWNRTAARHSHGGWRWRRYESTGRSWPSAEGVRKLFGSWNAAIAAAGFAPRAPGRRSRRSPA